MLKTSLRLAWRGLNHLTRIALVAAMLLAFAIGMLVLGLRYWILPDIEHYHDEITASVSQAIGLPVTVGRIEADWRGVRPHLSFTDVRILDKNKPGTTALALQHVDGVVSWRSLIWGGLRLYSLELDQPDLLVRRDAQGLLHIAGVTLADQSSGQNGLANWLLHQTYIAVRNARVTWLDEQRAAPPLVFNQLNLLIENSWRHHRFSVNALPPADLSAQLDVRGDFIGRSFNDLKAWEGQLYTRLDYADVSAWRTWLPLPAGFKRGRGALRGWLGFDNGKVIQLTADLVLADVRAQLGEGLLPLDLRTLRGRIGWQESAQGTEVSTHQLALRTEGVVVPPTDFYLRVANASDARPASGEIRANRLELANLVSLTDYLPLGQVLKKTLAEFAPQGTVSGLQAKWQDETGKPMHYEVKAKFEQLSMKRTEKLPGFSGLSGELEGTDATGTLSLNGRKLTLDAPRIMPEPLAFDRFSGQSSWRVDKSGLEVKFSDVSAANSDVSGTIYGSFQTLPDSPGLIDLNINLTRGAIGHADRYIPLDALGQETHAWLRSALLDGQADEFHLRLKGNLKDFPFPENRKGIFQVQARIKGAEVQYAKDWPRVNNAAGELLIQGKRLEVTGLSGMTEGESLQNARVVMPDMESSAPMLHVRGDVTGETSHALEFIQKSPVRGYIDGFTDNMTARGKGDLHLSVDVSLLGDKRAAISGSYHFTDNELDLGGRVPVLYAANGDLLFTESSVHTQDLHAQVLGGPATLALQSGADGALQVNVHGKADMDMWRKNVSYPWLSRLHGGADWDASIAVQNKQANVLVTSNLSGLVSDLPAPFSKDSGEVIPLRFEIKNLAAGRDVVSLQYGNWLSARFLRREEGGDMAIKRGTVNFGGDGRWMGRKGVWVSGTVPYLSLEGWGGLLFPAGSGGSGGGSGAPFSIAGADLTIQKIVAYGHSVEGLRINARGKDGVLAAQLTSKEINGELSWQSQGEGRLVAHLRNLVLGGGSSRHVVTAWEPAVDANPNSTVFPALDLTVDELTWKDKQLGKVELLAQQHGSDWLLDNMRLTNPDGVLTATGKYHMAEGRKQTQVKLKLEISNAGKILARSGYPNSVKNGSGKLEGEFAWSGAPDDFSYATLDGKLALNTGKGQFLKIDPGVGKLLGILSLQALPRHIALDFTDVFSDGFAFDSITGTAQIKQGVLETNDFGIDGSSAKVTMQGQIDLDQETQNLRVRILPSVGSSVSLLGAFTAGPLVGLGTLIVNKLLRDPLDKLVSFEYNVTGTWSDPKVVKIGQHKADSQIDINP